LRGHLSTLGPYVVDAIDNTILLERRGKNLAANFDAINAHDGLVGWECVTFSLLVGEYTLKWFTFLITMPIFAKCPFFGHL
jgi:hypothetical protein